MRDSSVNRDSSNGAVASEIKFAGNDNKDKMYEPKHKRKLIRVLTVIGYIFSVSLAAIMLSLFYVFIYNPGKLSGDQGKSQGMSQDEIFIQRGFHITNEDSLNSLNDTFANLEREEPRALPLGEMDTSFQTQAEKTTLNETSEKISSFTERANKTSDHKMIKILKLH